MKDDRSDIPPPPAAVVAVQREFESHAAPEAAKPESAPATPRSIPTVIGVPPPPLEELSSSSLIPVSEPRLPPASASPDSLPPPTDPVVHEAAYPLGRPSEPDAKGAVATILADLRATRTGGTPNNRFVVPVVGVVGGLTALALIAGVVSMIRGGGDKPVVSAAPVESVAPVVPAASSSAPRAAEPAAPTAKAAVSAVRAVAAASCTIAGPAKVVASKAVVSVGVEAAALGSQLVVGFALTPRDGAGAVLAPDTMATTATLKGRSADAVKRVTPFILPSGRPAVATDGERKGDKLASRRAVATTPAIDVGVAEGNLVWTPHGRDTWATLFGLEGSGPVEALRVVALPEGKGIAVAFRRDGLLWFGAALGDAVLEAKGPLTKITPKGQVGSPSIAASGNDLVLAWAERASADAPWTIRATRAPLGGPAAEPTTFELPPGGPASDEARQAMSPHVTSLGGGKTLLSWTEGPSTSHQARAIVLDERGKAASAPLEISPPGVNAGQSQAAVGADGKGVAVFLGAKGKGYDVMAVPLTCK